MAGYKIVLIPGEGVGPEIMVYAERVLRDIAGLEVVRVEAGMDYYRRTGKPYPDELESLIAEADAVIKGPLATPVRGGYRSITVTLRRMLGVYADIRRFETPRVRLVIVREASEGAYTGVEGVFGDAGVTLRVVTRGAARRVAEAAFNLARKLGYSRVVAVHKATILRASDGVFLEEFYNVARRYPDIDAGDMLVDSAAYHIVKNPDRLGVIVAPNEYGDILSDVAAAVAGSIGLFAAAEIGEKGALFEPIHGTGADIAGRGIANPVSALRAAQYLLEYLAEKHGDNNLYRIAGGLAEAIDHVVWREGIATPDLGGENTTSEVGEAILSRLASQT